MTYKLNRPRGWFSENQKVNSLVIKILVNMVSFTKLTLWKYFLGGFIIYGKWMSQFLKVLQCQKFTYFWLNIQTESVFILSGLATDSQQRTNSTLKKGRIRKKIQYSATQFIFSITPSFYRSQLTLPPAKLPPIRGGGGNRTKLSKVKTWSCGPPNLILEVYTWHFAYITRYFRAKKSPARAILLFPLFHQYNL